jgi:hypothetical protein
MIENSEKFYFLVEEVSQIVYNHFMENFDGTELPQNDKSTGENILDYYIKNNLLSQAIAEYMVDTDQLNVETGILVYKVINGNFEFQIEEFVGMKQ